MSKIDKPFLDLMKINYDEMNRVTQSLGEMLKQRGYLNSSVSYKLSDEILHLIFNLGDNYVVGDIKLGFDQKEINLKFPLIIEPGDIFSSDLINVERSKVLEELKSSGFFFAKVSPNIKLVEFDDVTKKVNINFGIKPGRKCVLGEIKYQGLVKTKKNVISREIRWSKGDTLTPGLVQDINDSLVSLNIFSFLSISPVVSEVDNGENKVDLIINIKEKDYGVITASPGFRTDIGLQSLILIYKGIILRAKIKVLCLLGG